jgi:peptidoglycan-associated lipoprotein
MFKKAIFFSIAAAVLMTGCSQKKPKPAKASALTADTVTLEDGGVSGQNRYNGSSDGMKSVYFGFGVYDLSPSEEGTVRFDAGVLRQKLGGKRVKLEGNCDEFGTDEYNYALGLKRAKAVKDSLQAQGIPGNKIVIVSYGESNPQCREATDSCYARNRRVDLHLLR